MPKNITLLILNALLFFFVVKFLRKKNGLSFFASGKWWLTWIAIAVITLMDELTSIFYAPGEAYRLIGIKAIFFIAFTSIVMRILSNRMVEIAHVLEEHKLKGGGVYNFSYLVTGPVLSFIAVASILVDYVLTASISTVSAIENGLSFISLGTGTKFVIEFAVVWAIAGLNIIGIKENAKVTFGIFIFTAFVFLNFIVAGLFHLTPDNFVIMASSAQETFHDVRHGVFTGYASVVANVSCCILAYSGIESVLQTARLVKDWHAIRKAYTFLALTVGIVTPVVVALVLSQTNIDFAAHETDLIPYFAAQLNGQWFGILLSVVASITLIMAVNTAYVASSELIERVAHRYHFSWITKTNRWDSLYLIHICNAIFYSFIIFITNGKQSILAEMYALGLVASFVINMGSLLVYRYQKGKTEAQGYLTNRTMTLVLFVLLFSCFVFLIINKPYGTVLWFGATGISLLIGLTIARKRSPEIKQAGRGDSTMDLIMYMAAANEKNINIHFKRPFDQANLKLYDLSVYITYYSPRQGIPPKLAPNHFRIPAKRVSLYNAMRALLDLINFEMPEHNVTVHLGWPMSSWIDRLSVGVMTYQMLRLPLKYPNINFKIEQFARRKKTNKAA